MQHSIKRTLGVRSFLAAGLCLAGLSLGFAPAPAPSDAALIVAVWDMAGQPVDGAAVTTLGEAGGVKAIPQGNGMYLLPHAGTQYGALIKATVEVQHALLGSARADMLFEAAPTLRLELVYTGTGTIDAYSPQSSNEPAPSPGDGAPVNDDCGGAIAVEPGVPTQGSTVGASVDTSPACVTSITAPGVWYSVTGTGNMMTASTCSTASDFDTKLTVYCGGCDALNCLTGNDDDCALSGLLSTASWCSEQGAEYLILVHGFSSGVGGFQLLVSDGGVPCADAVPCLPKGACCFTDGSCDQLTALACAAAGGNYSGDGVDCFTSLGSQTFTSSPNVAIPDFSPAGVSDSLGVASSFVIGDLDLQLFVNHTWQGDLIVTLRHEDTGTEATLVDRIGVPATTFGCGEDNWVGVVLDDGGALPIEGQCVANLSSPPSLAPSPGLLASFAGEDMAGTWTLTISDNAELDTGSLVSWSLIGSEAGSPVCPQPECFLVVGDSPGLGSFYGAWHEFDTQVAGVEDSFPVQLDDIPHFVLPPLVARGTTILSQVAPVGGSQASELEPWMQDGHFAVQVLMWNPVVFPGMPEQFTAGLDVEVLANGKVKVTPFGDNLGGLSVAAQIDTLPDGTRVISFPFQIPGF